jgi:hypothetical protein
MSGIIIAALITAAATTGVWGSVILLRAGRPQWDLLALCFLLQLPMSAATFYAIRVPIDGVLHVLLNGNALYGWAKLFYAPLTEEPAKLWPLLLPWIATRVSRGNAAHVAAALGLGFGVGEIGLLAQLISAVPQTAGRAWYELSGFIVERFMVCLIHGLLTAMAVFGWKCWRIGFGGGLAIGMALHFALNFSIAVAGFGWLGADHAVAMVILSLWNLAFFVAAILVLLVLNTRIAGAALSPVRSPT